MADNVESPGPDAPAPQGAFPADLFDDAAEPSPLSSPPPSEALAPVPAPAPVAADDAPPGAPIFPVVVAVLMVVVLVIAVFVSRLPREEAAAATSTATPVEPGKTAPADTTGKELGDRIDGLASQLKALESKVDGLSRPAPAPDLKPIQARIDDLARSVAAVAPVAEKVEKLEGRLAGLEAAVKAAQGEVTALAEEVKKAAAARPAVAAPAPAAASEPRPDGTAADLDKGIELFKAGKYKEAADAFTKLAESGSKDARVYYYAALSRGLATNDWKGQTLTIAARGAELEKSGATKPAEVDAAFADLPPTLKPWLAFFRKAARP